MGGLENLFENKWGKIYFNLFILIWQAGSISMSKFSYVLVSLMLTLAFSKLLHSQTAPNQKDVDYFQALLAKEYDLKLYLAQIQNSIKYVNKTLSQVQGNTDSQIVALSDAMADERYMLSTIQQTHVLPLSLKSTNCTNISQADLSQINLAISQINNDLLDLNNSINQLESSVTTPDNYTKTCIDNLRLQKLWAENYLKTLKGDLVKCPTPTTTVAPTIGIANVTNYSNITNLGTTNWIYGNISASDYNIKLFQYMTTNNVTKCPVSAPNVMANTSNCSACPLEAPLFDISSGTCVNCPPKYVFDAVGHQCILNLTCPAGFKLNTVNLTCECSDANPFFDGKSCYSCFLPNFWNRTSLKCEKCPDGAIYNFTSEVCSQCPVETPMAVGIKCEKCDALSFYNATSKKCEITPNCSYGASYVPNLNKCVCPLDRPHDDGYACQACQNPMFWNETTKACGSCPDGSVFNFNQSICVECPASAPIELNGACKPCPSSTFYSPMYKICLICASNEIYDSVNNTCKPNTNSTNGTNITTPTVTPKCEAGATLNTTSGKCQCPSDRPYSNQLECLPCPYPNYWNSDLLRCDICPFGLIYNKTLRRCDACPSATPIIINGECKACPNGTYFDQNNKICVMCSTGAFFNSTTSQCQQIETKTITCSIGATFNAALNKCVCPTNASYDNGAQCIPCDTPAFFNETIKSCSQCKDGQFYDKVAKQCVNCPDSAPIEKQGVCYGCPAGTYYFSDNKICISCPPNQVFNQTTKTCSGVDTARCSLKGTFSQTLNKCVCPTDLPFDNGIECTTCPYPYYWSVVNSTCQVCSYGLVYDSVSKSCISCPADKPLASNGVCTACPSGSYYISNPGVCLYCGPGTIFVAAEQTCKAFKDVCPTGYYWSTKYSQCTSCPEGTVWDVDHQNCYKCPTYTNYDSATKSCATDWVQFAANCTRYELYFNGNACVACPDQSFWNTTAKGCQTCAFESTYDASRKVCVTCPTGYTFDKNTFSCNSWISSSTWTTTQWEDYCKSNGQLYNGNQCVYCFLPKYWDPTARQCKDCQANTNFDIEMKNCVTCSNFGKQYSSTAYKCVASATSSSSSTTTTTTTTTSSTSTANWTTSQWQAYCLTTRQVFDGTKCVFCYLPRYWDPSVRQCKDCSPNTNFDISQNICLTCPSGQVYSTTAYMCVKA